MAMLSALVGLGMAMSMAGQAATPAAPRSSTAAAANAGHKLQAQLQDVDAKVSSARAHNAELESQVTAMERQNADRQKQMQQRDAQIAALQEKLQAAGASAPASSAGD
ncbi:MAG: hypothetical protein ACREP2_04490 [Rhodanobacteraceae bacterium]